MPLYAYRCENDHEFEVRQKMMDDPLTECIICEASARRVIKQVGVVFKGSGFYVNDHKGNNSAAPKTTSEKSDNGSSSDSKSSETKSESKSESTAKAEPAASSSGSGSDS